MIKRIVPSSSWVQVGVIRSKSSLRDKLIVTANAEVAIRSFREADRPQLERLWTEVFSGEPSRNAPDRMIDGVLGVRPESIVIVGLLGRADVAALDFAG